VPVDVNIDFVLHACRNLLVVDAQLQTCGFSHLSVQEYFESRVWTLSQAHAFVAKTSLALLFAEERQHDESTAGDVVPGVDLALEPSDKSRVGAVSPLLGYAINNWPTHVQKHGEDDIDLQLVALLKRFLGSMDDGSSTFKRWHSLHCKTDRGLCTVCQSLAPPSHSTFGICFFGFDTVLADWWQCGPADPGRLNEEGNSLLHIVVMGSSLGVTRKLMGLGLDVNADGSPMDGCPLSAAACKGSMQMMQLLLDVGAIVNRTGGRFGCPLGPLRFAQRLRQ
jgi:hypothetical protein